MRVSSIPKNRERRKESRSGNKGRERGGKEELLSTQRLEDEERVMLGIHKGLKKEIPSTKPLTPLTRSIRGCRRRPLPRTLYAKFLGRVGPRPLVVIQPETVHVGSPPTVSSSVGCGWSSLTETQ